MTALASCSKIAAVAVAAATAGAAAAAAARALFAPLLRLALLRRARATAVLRCRRAAGKWQALNAPSGSSPSLALLPFATPWLQQRLRLLRADGNKPAK